MQFFYKIFSKNSYCFFNFAKEIILALLVICVPISYGIFPRTAHAGLFSTFFDLTGGEAAAQILSVPDEPNSQNMVILKATQKVGISDNSLNDYPVLASENALVAEIGPSGTLSEIEEEPANTAISIYVVRSDDTLSEIAEMFGVSVNTIIWANDLVKNPIIKEGQTLIILPITGIKHVVKKGETIASIVKKYKIETNGVNEILDFNGLTADSVLKEGEVLMIPDAEPTIIETPSKSKTNSKPLYAGYYMRPIAGGIKSQGLHGNNAVDLAAPIGTPIMAAADGTVIANMFNGGWNGGYGNYVIISHPNGTQTLYAHTSVNAVSIGQKVKKGDMIARIGITGKTSGPHVHFEIRGARNPF